MVESITTWFLILLICIIRNVHVTGLEIIDVMSYGAKGDGKSDDTHAIRTALHYSTSDNIIWLPPDHVFLSQPLNLTSNTTLQVDGILKSKNKIGSWPQLPPLPSYNTSGDGPYLQYQAFLYASNASNIKIMGIGEIDGSGGQWWSTFEQNASQLAAGRPSLLQFHNCQYVELSHVTLRDSPYWCVHPVYCDYVYIHHITIQTKMNAHNSDGIDPDSSRHVLIEHNDLSCGDDHVSVKAGRCGSNATDLYPECNSNQQFHDGSFQTENVTIRYNVFRRGHGIAIGSESSGGIRNVDIYNNIVGLCQDCSVDDSTQCCGYSEAFRVKTTPSRGGVIENISYHDNIVYNTSGFILLTTHYQTMIDDVPEEYRPASIRNISFVRNQALGKSGIKAEWNCSKLDACHDIHVEDNYMALKSESTPWNCENIQSFTVSGNYPDGLGDCMEQSMNTTTTGSGIESVPS